VGQSPAFLLVDEQTGRVLVVNQSGNTVSVVDARTGAVLRTVAVGEYPDAAAVDEHSGRAFVGAFDGTVSVIDTRSGKLLRTTMVGGGVNALAVDQRAGHVIVTSYRQSNGSVSVLDATSGRLLHTVTVGFYTDTLTVDERIGRAFVMTLFNNSINLFDTRTGALLRTVSVRHTPGAVAVDARTGRAFVTSPTDDTLTVLDARSGARRSTITLDRHTPGATPWVSDALAVDERAGRVFVAEDNGSAAHVSVLDVRGRIVHHAGPVGVFPMAVAVDTRAGHVVIVGGPLLQQSNAFEAITASLADFLSKHLKHMLTWFWGSTAGGASSGDERGSISVLSVPR
jgi:YVTN family beta-propeller protein